MLDLTKLDKTDDPAELLKLLLPWVDEESSRYQALQTEWEKNVLFYLGKQWIQRRDDSNGYEVLEETDDHYRPVTNYTARLCHFKRSQVLGRNIRPIVKPNSEKKEDTDSARLGSLALKAKFVSDNEEELASLAFLHAEIFGICWRSDFKKPVPRQYIEIPVTEKVRSEYFKCPTCSRVQGETSTCESCGDTEMSYEREDTEQARIDPMTGMPMMQRLPIYETAVAINDPFRMKCNPCKTAADLRWIHECSIQQVSWIKEAFSVEAEGFLGEEQVEKVKKLDKMPRGLKISEEFQSAIAYAHSSVFKEVSVTARDSKESCQEDATVFNKLYVYPSENYSFGRLLIFTPTAVLYDGKPDVPNNKKLKRWHGYSNFNYTRHPLRFEGIPFIEDLIPINKQINALDAMIMEHLDKTASPERVEFSNVQKNNQDQSDGVIIIEPRPELPNGGIPTYLTHPQMANEVYRMRQDKVSEMEKIANVPEVVQGLRPAGVDTYGGLQLLRDSADSSESELYNDWYAYTRSASQLKLAIIQECLINNDPDLVEMMEQIRQNEDMGKMQVTTFLGEDLRNNLNVSIEESDYLHESKGAEADRVKQLIDTQILSPQDLDDPIVKINLLRKLGIYTINIPQKADIEKMERIIQLFEDGNGPQAMASFKPYDDLMIQSRMLKDWMKSDRFVDIPQPVQQQVEMMLKNIMAAMQPPLPPGPMKPGMSGKGPPGMPPPAPMGAGGPPPGPMPL